MQFRIKKYFKNCNFLLEKCKVVVYYYIVQLISYINMKSTEFTREERAAISSKFRSEIASYGVMNEVLTVLDSTSEKNEVKKTVLSQQCRKKDFAAKFRAACEEIRAAYPAKRIAVRALSDEILPA